ncbi:hypothetical protein [Amycolatopsis acidicola]|uniref:hypothetical protein n=1 Tax=Amycolatopsis acidicola TaxID=2596893 RepID=UPI00140C2422|nr:hypothetical protein [Amycolatopsis acidicola]
MTHPLGDVPRERVPEAFAASLESRIFQQRDPIKRTVDQLLPQAHPESRAGQRLDG